MPTTSERKTETVTREGFEFKIKCIDAYKGGFWVSHIAGALAQGGTKLLSDDMRIDELAQRIGLFLTMDEKIYDKAWRDFMPLIGVKSGEQFIALVDESRNVTVDVSNATVVEMLTRAVCFSVMDFFSSPTVKEIFTTLGISQTTSETSPTPPLNTDIGDNTNSGTAPTA